MVEQASPTSALSPVNEVVDPDVLALNLDLPEDEQGKEASIFQEIDELGEDDGAIYVVPEEEVEPTPEPTPRRATIRKRSSMRLSNSGSFVGAGWRNWRAGSQPGTPSGEVPPQLSYIVQPPSVGASSTADPSDYFGVAMTSRLASITEASPSSQGTSMLRVGSQERALMQLPKLSPEFSFGRRTPSPAPPSISEASSSYITATEEDDVAPLATPRKLRESLVPMPGKAPPQRRNRAASADHGVLPNPKHVAANPVTTARVGSSSSVSHRNRLAMRKFAGNAPRFQARSFDAEELKLLREMTAPKYNWI